MRSACRPAAPSVKGGAYSPNSDGKGRCQPSVAVVPARSIPRSAYSALGPVGPSRIAVNISYVSAQPHTNWQAKLEMSLRGTIRRRDDGPLGTVEEVKRHLSDAFPGVWFAYQAVEPPGVADVRKNMPLFLRLWLSIFGERTRYPNHHGYFEREIGGAVEFYFEGQDPVRWIRATSYGTTAGLDDSLTGYPPRPAV